MGEEVIFGEPTPGEPTPGEPTPGEPTPGEGDVTLEQIYKGLPD